MTVRRGSVTVGDVARQAGVSLGTVSKALNGRGQLREETRERVIAAASELGFEPNFVARSLLSGRTYTVGVLTTDNIGRFTIPLLAGAEDALGPGQMSMLLCESRGDYIREQYYLRTLISRRVDGIIVTGRGSDERPSIGRDLPVPVVYALVRSEHPDDLSIVHDDEGGAVLAIEHLLATGRRNIAFVNGPVRHAASTHRAAGVARAMTAANAELVTGEPMHGAWSERWGREAAATLVSSGVHFDGVFCASDQIARGVLDALREAQRRVPEEIGVVGVDNWDVMAEAARPPLTSIDLNLRGLGQTAAQRLLEAIGGKELHRGVTTLPCHLVTRHSTEIMH